MTDFGQCRGCGARFLWARTPKGALMPIEATRRPGADLTANVAAFRNGAGGAYRKARAASGTPRGGKRWTFRLDGFDEEPAS